jgi:hypothetical protein
MVSWKDDKFFFQLNYVEKKTVLYAKFIFFISNKAPMSIIQTKFLGKYLPINYKTNSGRPLSNFPTYLINLLCARFLRARKPHNIYCEDLF